MAWTPLFVAEGNLNNPSNERDLGYYGELYTYVTVQKITAFLLNTSSISIF
jgi:hypothetical protein